MLNRKTYNFILGFCIFYGFALNYIICKYFSEYFISMNPVKLVIGYFVLCIAGIFISKSSQNPIISFIGYNLIVVPIGAVLSVALSDYKGCEDIIIESVAITGAITALMTILACIFPDFFRSLGKILIISLTGLILCELILVFFLNKNFIIIQFIGCGIFCGYIGYDFVKAQDDSPTIDNAVDNAVGLYLDIINLFLRILSSKSKK